MISSIVSKLGKNLMLTVSLIMMLHAASSRTYLSPAALVASQNGKTLYVACATANRVLCFDLSNRTVAANITMWASPSGMALAPDGLRLYVTCAAPESKVCIVDVAQQKVVGDIPAGHTAMAPVVSPDGKFLYVCNQFNNDVSVIDLAAEKQVRRIVVRREPVAADITKDGRYLLVANQLPAGPADGDYVAAVVSVIDLAAGKVSKELILPHGSGSLKDIKVSPDGKYAAVSHILARFDHPTTEVYRGWINVNGLTIIDIASLTIKGTILLDEPDRGAANPWGVAWSEDGAKLLVTHAGTHEISVIDFATMVAELLPVSGMSSKPEPADQEVKYTRQQALDSNYLLPFLVGSRHWIRLPAEDLGPRALVIVGQVAYVADYFSDTLSLVDLKDPQYSAISIALGPKKEMDIIRRGEFYFHNASLCYQSWQSCSSCHPGGARVDGFNWDLLNDGVGNPKNTKSLLLAHQTPPVMSLGIRASAEIAVRAGIEHILFTNLDESIPVAIDEYLKSLRPVPSPFLVAGKLSPAAERGKLIFERANCADCHPPGLFTDLRPHDVGTRRSFDRSEDRFYTPTLIEVWRTAPYLHDGSATTVRDVITTHNPDDKLGTTSNLSGEEIDDLCAYVLSL